MQIVIDIPKEMFEWVNDVNKFYKDYDVSDFIDVIKNGTPIPDNATNGEIIEALYPNAEFSLYSDIVDRVAMNIRVNGTEYEIHFDEDWWDSPYQKEDKNEKENL